MAMGRENRRWRRSPSLSTILDQTGGGVRHPRAVRQSRSRPPDDGSAQALSGTLDPALRRALAESADAKRGRAASGATRARRKAASFRPILANLFLHYAFDLWVTRHLPGVRFARYADDAVLHCKSRRQAEYVLDRIRERFQACNLGTSSEQDTDRVLQGRQSDRDEPRHPVHLSRLHISDPRKAVDKYGRVYVNFSPAVSHNALKAMRQTNPGMAGPTEERQELG